MGALRLYKNIYRINAGPTGQTYTLINADSITATSVIRNSTNVVETLTPVLESTGEYFVELTPNLYTFTDIYEVQWVVTYISGSSSKMLITRFRMNPINISGGAIIEIIDKELILETARNQIILDISNAT